MAVFHVLAQSLFNLFSLHGIPNPDMALLVAVTERLDAELPGYGMDYADGNT